MLNSISNSLITILDLQPFPREQDNKRQVCHVGRHNKELVLKPFVKFFQHYGCDVYGKEYNFLEYC